MSGPKLRALYYSDAEPLEEYVLLQIDWTARSNIARLLPVTQQIAEEQTTGCQAVSNTSTKRQQMKSQPPRPLRSGCRNAHYVMSRPTRMWI